LKKKKEKTLEELLGINDDDDIISYSNKINSPLNSSSTWMEDVIDTENEEDKEEKEEKKKKKDAIPEVLNKGSLGMKFQYGGYMG
jgi:hypothetical protein